ncbi:sialate O-acetylesterase [Pontibacter sp. HSC-14F20]|uniref:sialate O-acetylesterase n=1 Tax=Pontibacter sp. HSC-14F20 TaxID=2864136 RepID=UPI001C735A9C|nr:sialate O-acetylesterase [Pontibacter sp. HSC-14F20]MBX0335126.1 sialate O-acetylesterase [Pontibacter sp. HSC-14F20]
MRTAFSPKLLLLYLLLSISTAAYSQIKLPRLISNGMVLQRETGTRLWGWAKPGEAVRLTFKQKEYRATTGPDGKWTIQLPPQQAGGPYEMTFTASNNITLKNILFGDVWICGGQSNMELPMERVQDTYPEAIAKANYPNIRQFEIPDRYDFKQTKHDVEAGEWLPATTQNIRQFSAVAFFFAEEIHNRYNVPVGLINSALGGSPAEAWISEVALKKFPSPYRELQKFKDDALIARIEADDQKASQAWYARLNETDEGRKNNWAAADVDDSDWAQMAIPGYWADGPLGQVNGVVWFRREIDVPKSMVGKEAKLMLGRIVDADEVYLNGELVGTTSYQYPPRRYLLPANKLKEGKNTLAVRVINNAGRGGFIPDKPYDITGGEQALDLKGYWKYKLGATMEAAPGQTFIRWKPTGLYNAMIAPLTDLPIKGVLWYQGESNTRNPSEYASLMETLIADWRGQWGQGNFPFIYVQLANLNEPNKTPVESNWAALRQAQLENLALPNTGMAVAMDLGEWNDIHPLNKRDVGLRLALQARKLAYGDKAVVASGPLFESMQAQGNKLTLVFSDTGKGLVAKGNKPLSGFAIAGADGKFVWAKAEIKKNKVVVWSEAIAKPVTVRYAWADNPEGANLYNKEGLPASPFEARLDTSTSRK